MKLSVLQHAAYEGPGEIAVWAAKHGHSIVTHHLYHGSPLPALDSFDALIVMGGEMNIYQYRDWPWLKPERELIRATLDQGKRVVGICLGAQLIADALGSRVVQNKEIELGWFPVDWSKEAFSILPEFPASSTVLHWHGDTFELPAGATRLATSIGCPEQGYLIKNKCLGLQFHMEVDPDLVELYVKGQVEWPKGTYTQSPKAILEEASKHCEKNSRLLQGMLDLFFQD